MKTVKQWLLRHYVEDKPQSSNAYTTERKALNAMAVLSERYPERDYRVHPFHG